jgi:hypothetical protein
MNDGYTGGIGTRPLNRLARTSPPDRTRCPRNDRGARQLLLVATLWLATAGPALGQWLPAEPVTWLGGTLVVSGDASISYSTSDHGTYYNYGDYESDMMRLVRLGVGAALRLGSRASVLADIRTEGDVDHHEWRVYPISLVVSVRPVAGSRLAVAAGIVQPVFGAFTQRRYGADNLLIGYPLAYQYTTAVRADALPATADEVLNNRARGWAPHYTIGASAGVSGLPIVNTSGWSPGLVVSGGTERVSVKVAVTGGGLAAAGSADWGGRWEVTGRAEWRPTPGLVVGLSGAHGAFVSDALSSIVQTAVNHRQPRETAFGMDVEYSWGYWLLRGETIVSARSYPAFASPYLNDPLTTVAVEGEARYKIRPGLYAAVRVGGLSFGAIRGSAARQTWDADLARVETGLGYSFTRNILVKTVYQYNRRDSTRKASLHLVAAQLVVKF